MSPLISATELKQLLDAQSTPIQVLDASIDFQIPSELAKITGQVIPDALRFDYDHHFCDPESSLPHMMPSEVRFNQLAQQLGLYNESLIVVYDNSGTYASPRAWWMLKAMGHHNVRVLNGGLRAWIAAGYPTLPNHAKPKEAGNFSGTLNPHYFLSAGQVLQHSQQQSANIIDARSLARFNAEVPEPREGIRSGHIPNAQCLPFSQVLQEGMFKQPQELRAEFAALNLPQQLGCVFSCGSGVTACIILLAAYLIGLQDLAIYDGSWTEWGANANLPIA